LPCDLRCRVSKVISGGQSQIDYQKAGKQELEVELVSKPTGKNLIGSNRKFGKIWIIAESLGGPFIATVRTDLPANFLRRNGGRARAGDG
jgi:hypothetical protein